MNVMVCPDDSRSSNKQAECMSSIERRTNEVEVPRSSGPSPSSSSLCFFTAWVAHILLSHLSLQEHIMCPHTLVCIVAVVVPLPQSVMYCTRKSRTASSKPIQPVLLGVLRTKDSDLGLNRNVLCPYAATGLRIGPVSPCVFINTITRLVDDEPSTQKHRWD